MESITSALQHMKLCIAEHVRKSVYRERGPNVYRVDIYRVLLGRDGYTPDGRYFGAGAPLFACNFECDDGGLYTDHIRATSRTALRAELKAVYPTAKIGR